MEDIGIWADFNLLDDYCSRLNKEKRLARQLLDQLREARQTALPEEEEAIARLIRDAGKVNEYCSRICTMMEDFRDDLMRTSGKIGTLVADARWNPRLSRPLL